MKRIIRADRFENMRLRMDAEDAAVHNVVVQEVPFDTPAGVTAVLAGGYATEVYGTHQGLVFDGPQDAAIEAVLRLYCPRDPATLDGAEIIAAERKRQIEQEGWSEEHDNAHKWNELAWAATCYAMPPLDGRGLNWPWDRKWWKPTPDDRIRELAKAGALIAAEIDRLKRAELQKPRCQHKIRRVTNAEGQYERRCEKCGIEAHSDGDFSYMCGREYCRCMS